MKEKIRNIIMTLAIWSIPFVLGMVYGHKMSEKSYHCFFQNWYNPDPICLGDKK